MSNQQDHQTFQTVAGLSHVAIRARDISDSVRYYTDVLGLREAFRMYREDGSLATVYMYLAPGQYLELFSDGTREGVTGPDVIGMCHLCLMTKDIPRSFNAVKAAGGPLDSEIKRGKSECRMFWTHDPDGTRIEVMEMPPESLQAQADRRFEKTAGERSRPMEALEAIMTRRSTRNYKPDPVEPEKIEKILEAGRQAPSGGNNQTSHFLVIRNREVLDRLVTLTEKAFAGMEITENMYASMKHSVEASKKGGYVFCYNAPLLIAVANRKDYGNNIADCACALENMMVAANALDLGSCWINQLKWLNEDPEILKYLFSLGMKETERVYGAVIVGYPATGNGLPNRNLMKLKGNEITWID